MQQQQKKGNPTDGLFSWVVGCLLAVPMLYLVYLFVEVVFLGGSSACPQNLC